MSQPAAGIIAVTGASGALGGRVASSLASEGLALRLLGRDLDRVPHFPGSEAAAASYEDGSAVTRALAGVDTVLMVSAKEAPERLAQHRSFVDGALAAGVRHIVYTSFFGAAPHATFTFARDHFGTEEYIRGTGVGFTFLRDNFYLDVLPGFAGPDGVIAGPAGTGRVAAVSRDDVARVASVVLRSISEHAGATYDLTGPEALTFVAVAETVTAVSGTPTVYREQSVEEAYLSRGGQGTPQWLLDAWVTTYTAVAKGELDGVSSAVQDITGQRPTSLEEYLRAG